MVSGYLLKKEKVWHEAIKVLQSFRVFHAKLPMKDANDRDITVQRSKQGF